MQTGDTITHLHSNCIRQWSGDPSTDNRAMDTHQCSNPSLMPHDTCIMQPPCSPQTKVAFSDVGTIPVSWVQHYPRACARVFPLSSIIRTKITKLGDELLVSTTYPSKDWLYYALNRLRASPILRFVRHVPPAQYVGKGRQQPPVRMRIYYC